jgi:hypothetical protein
MQTGLCRVTRRRAAAGPDSRRPLEPLLEHRSPPGLAFDLVDPAKTRALVQGPRDVEPGEGV